MDKMSDNTDSVSDNTEARDNTSCTDYVRQNQAAEENFIEDKF